MSVSVAAVMRQVRHFFERECFQGQFAIAGGALVPAPDAPYLAISGSASCDGVWKAGELPERYEVFEGKVWGLYPPKDFLDLCQQISEFDDRNPLGALRSESFGAYSYDRFGSAGSGWENAFARQLAPYRRMFTEVDVS